MGIRSSCAQPASVRGAPGSVSVKRGAASSRHRDVRSMPTKAVERLQLQEYLPYRLSVAANAVSRLIARAYEDQFGLTIPQWRVMAVLGDEGARTQQSLCGRTLMDKVTV